MNKNQPIDEYCSMMFLLAALMRSSIPPTIPAAGPSGRSRSVPRAESSAERSSSPWTGADTAVRSASRLRRHHRPAARPRLGEDLPGRNAHLHVALVATRPRCALSAGTESRGPAKQPTCKCEAGDSRRKEPRSGRSRTQPSELIDTTAAIAPAARTCATTEPATTDRVASARATPCANVATVVMPPGGRRRARR